MINKAIAILISGLICSMVLANIIGPLPAHALETTDDIDTNRPSFTDSPLVVPRGSLQAENGTLYQHFQHGSTYYDIPETEVRYGLTRRTEFQMFVPNYVLLRMPGPASVSPAKGVAVAPTTQTEGTHNGVSDLTEIGVKHQFGPFFKDLNIAFIGGVTPPTGSSLISGRGVTPALRSPWNKALSKNWTICGMQSLLVVNAGRDVQWQNFWLLCRAIGARTTVFTEYAGFYTHHSTPINIAHFGVVRKLNRNNQVDLHFGFGMNKSSPVALVGVGYSFRFDRLAW